jgi:hypothetical protein
MHINAHSRDASELSLHCESRENEQDVSAYPSICFGSTLEPAITFGAYQTRSLRHQRRLDLSCHLMAQVIAFYSKLLPCQPRAALKTKNKRRAFRPAVY